MWNNRSSDRQDWDELEEYYGQDYWNQIDDVKLEMKLSEWEDLKTKYYQALSWTVYSCKVGKVVDYIKKQLIEFKEYLECLDAPEFWFTEQQVLDFMDEDIMDISLSREYPHGWVSHTDEKEDNNLYLFRCLKRQVEGMNSISLRIHESLYATVTIAEPPSD